MPYKDIKKKREYQRRWIAARRASYLADKACVVCGSVENLQVDHIDPSAKWNHRFWSYSWEKIYAELEKCQILCQEHHDIKTSVDNDRNLPYTHGTRTMYEVHGCRCDACRDANTNKVRNFREKKKSMDV